MYSKRRRLKCCRLMLLLFSFHFFMFLYFFFIHRRLSYFHSNLLLWMVRYLMCVWTQLSVLISPCDKCVSFGTSVWSAYMCGGTIHNTFHLLAFVFLQKTIDRLAVLWCWWLSNECALFQAIWQQYLKIDMPLFRSSPVHISCIINVICSFHVCAARLWLY